MRLCRCLLNGVEQVGLYEDSGAVSLGRLAEMAKLKPPLSPHLLDYLPPVGRLAQTARTLNEHFRKLSPDEQQRLIAPLSAASLRVPIAEPKKIILLAGNYAEHIKEGGDQASERQDTFPYFFWKPPGTTLTHPGEPIRIPAASPDHIDWEIELGVVIGRQCKDVTEADALRYVAGYTVCNDISDRGFRINPGRKPRPKDGYFDWLHGKWHDTFLPMGPCIRSAATVADPQAFPLKLRLNGQVMQDGNTSQMIFSVAALLSILSTFMTLEPGDIISTGTPSGIGHARKPPVYLKAGDKVEAEVAGIGILRNPVA
jgi:2,4-diketo-3-deoxy-L-fuconate hydrolase